MQRNTPEEAPNQSEPSGVRAIDLTDVLAVGSALASLGPDPSPEQMLFLGIPAARRMKLDAAACVAALAESHEEIVSLRQALGT